MWTNCGFNAGFLRIYLDSFINGKGHFLLSAIGFYLRLQGEV